MATRIKKLLLLLFLFPIPLLSSKCIVGFTGKLGEVDQEPELLEAALSKFRWKQLKSFLLILFLVVISFIVVFIFCRVKITYFSYMQLISAILLSQSVFGRLGWEIQTWSGDSIIEQLNEWWFRFTYSIGIIFLFISLII